jgi:hypothetical protein
MVAWYLHVPVTRPTGRVRHAGYVLQVDREERGAWQPRHPRTDRLVAATGPWRVYVGRCARRARSSRRHRLHRA